MGLKVKRFASTALSGRPAEVEKMKLTLKSDSDVAQG